MIQGLRKYLNLQELDLSGTERDIDTFTEFMQCLYDNGASISDDNVETLLGLARKYQVCGFSSNLETTVSICCMCHIAHVSY